MDQHRAKAMSESMIQVDDSPCNRKTQEEEIVKANISDPLKDVSPPLCPS